MKRTETRKISVGGVIIGGGAAVTVQSMCNTPTHDAEATLAQIRRLADAGCDIVRVAVPDEAAAGALERICAESPLPVVADIHFDYRLALAAVREYCSVEDILAIAEERGEPPFVILCDEISDPHNLGAILRTAECVGAHGVIIPKRRSAGLTSIVDKTSAGAAEHMAVAPSGMWDTDLTGPLCLVIGSEGDGMGRLVAENCDFLLSIPMRGKVSSLNASAAASVVMYEVLRQRSN